jgi:hypothetical protein
MPFPSPFSLLSTPFLIPRLRQPHGPGNMLAMAGLSHGGLTRGLVSKVRTMGSDFKVKIFIKKLLPLDSFGPDVVL